MSHLHPNEWVDMAAEQLEAYLAGTLNPKIIMNLEATNIVRERMGGVLSS